MGKFIFLLLIYRRRKEGPSDAGKMEHFALHSIADGHWDAFLFRVFFFAFCFLIFILFFCHRNSCPLMEGRGVAETRPWPKVWRRKSACYAARFHSTLCVHPLPAFLLVLDVIETQPWPRKVSTAEKSFFFVFEKKRHDPIQRKTFRPFLFFSFSLSFGYFFC